ncbi:MAG: hypothetical protein IPP77_00150 [Bacteroidetes bacterium]|nr:hypothetical protein [Bacteroidota bacterium]
MAQAGADKSLSLCSGDSITIGDNPAATGGTGAYSYSWSPGTALSATNIANPIVKGLATTTVYGLTVTDASGCSSVDFVTVNVVTTTLSVDAGEDKEVCSGNCVQLGSFPTVVGGIPPYTYSWTGGSLSSNSTSNPVACNQSSENYTVTVTDSKGLYGYGCSICDD